MSLTKETDLYLYVKNFFESKGYFVKSEVKNCDVACIFKDELTIIELKKAFCLKLLYQALDRKKFADFVFICIPQPKNFRKKEVKYMINILKSLEIGLITVSIESPLKHVQIVYYPKKNKVKSSKKRNQILYQLEKSTVDFNLGGSSSKDFFITFHRENSIRIACFLKNLKTASPRELVKLGCDKNTGKILLHNHYGWFEKVSRGIYKISPIGEKIFSQDKYKKIVQYYEKEIQNSAKN